MSARFLWWLWVISPLLWADPLSYTRDIQPIFTAKCVACHACYDAPCQLNLGSGAGVVRGASKHPVYDGIRTDIQPTTRLFVDGQTEGDWRSLGFYSVLKPTPASSVALLTQMLMLGHHQSVFTANEALPKELELGITRHNRCPMGHEFEDFARTNPHAGMPFAVTGVTDDEYAKLMHWLAQGAPVDESPEQPSPWEHLQINEWETFLNAPDRRSVLVSRWLYEHLFLAHLYFESGTDGHFFELVRSATPSPQPIRVLATRRPNDDPGGAFFYRLRRVQGVIVHKAHVTYPLSTQHLASLRALFLSENWSLEVLPKYGLKEQSAPLETFEAIPAQARYRFLLDRAEYIVRSFIRGPVCRGPIATDVIRDNFWVLFQNPQQDLYLTQSPYRRQVTPLLTLPVALGGLSDLPDLWQQVRGQRALYAQLRQEAYAQAPAPDWSHLWLEPSPNAALSIFRQHDSASVHSGLIGAVPQTLWLLDFPLLERMYYLLVVNFDVFGNVLHQAMTRLYFDWLRNSAEQNFLRLMPADQRQRLLDDWYQSAGKLLLWLDYPALDTKTPSALTLPATEAKTAFARQLWMQSDASGGAPDPINRCFSNRCYRPNMPPLFQAAEQALAALLSRAASQLPVIGYLPEATFLRIEGSDGHREVYSLLRNRAHSNVAFILGESYRLQPERDTLTLYPGILSSYPNFLFNVRVEEAPEFAAALGAAASEEDFRQLVGRWGVRRTHPNFWRYFNDLSAYLQEQTPIEAGVLDMNRYQDL